MISAIFIFSLNKEFVNNQRKLRPSGKIYVVCHDVVTDEKNSCRYIKPKALIPECHILVQDSNNAVHEKTKKMWRNEIQEKKAPLFFFTL